MADDPNGALAGHLKRIEQLVADLRALKGFRSVKWEDLELEMRGAADELSRLGHAAKVYR